MRGDTPSWTEMYEYRVKMRTAYPAVWNLPVRRRAEDVLLCFVERGMSILDVGAGNTNLERMLTEKVGEVVYKSLHVDKKFTHGFRDASAVTGKFEVIVMFEVIEHLPYEEGLEMLRRLGEATKDGGKIVISTPNVFHPSAYFRDASHVTAYCYDELGASLLYAGFTTREVYRVHNAPFWKRMATRYIGSLFTRFLGMDYAPGIVAVAEKEAAGS